MRTLHAPRENRMYAHEHGVRDDGLGLSRGGGGVVVIGRVQAGRECAWRSVRRGPIGQRGRTSLERDCSTEQKAAKASHIGTQQIPRVCSRRKRGRQHGRMAV
jgi:hypothetical protein